VAAADIAADTFQAGLAYQLEVNVTAR